MTSREQFEKWFSENFDRPYYSDEERDELEVYTALAWRASRAAIEIELPTTIEVHPLGPSAAKMFCDLHKNTVAECAKSIRASGLKIKGE